MTTTAPYGSWHSPITANSFAQRSVRLSQLRVDGPDVYWVEGNPLREGRNVLLRRDAMGRTSEVLPLLEGSRLVHVRTRVHEYGGRAYAIKDGILVISDGTDNRVYYFDNNAPLTQLRPLTQLGDFRYGDFEIDLDRQIAYAICEDHRDPDNVINTLVSIPLDGSGARDTSKIRTVFQGTDFVSAPSLSPDGTRLAWLTWDHPNMPWTKSELRVASLDADGIPVDTVTLVDRPDVCVYEPRWTRNNELIHVDDSSGWANLYRTEGFTEVPGEPADAWATRLRTRALHPGPRAFSQPHWRLGLHSYDILDNEHLICSWAEESYWHLGTVKIANGLLEEWDIGWWPVGNVAAGDGKVVFLGDSADRAPSIVTVDGDTVHAIRPSTEADVDTAYVSVPELLSWPTRDGAKAHGFYYAPQNPNYNGPADSRPPLIVMAHGGPTSAARPGLSLSHQYLTTRGFAVLDVNYRGSTGYGRPYRDALNGNLGIYDALDCADGALFLIDQGLVDDKRIAIRGASSGGFTALSALIQTDVFSAGTSLYGISDLRNLVRETHKFEANFARLLLQSNDLSDPIWAERSPITNLDRINAPLLLLQGTADPIVPAKQTEQIYHDLVADGKQVAMVLFEGEGHGFSQPENIELAWRTELAFYAEVWGITLQFPVEVPIMNRPAEW